MYIFHKRLYTPQTSGFFAGKFHHFRAKITPLRWRLGWNSNERTGKTIYRRFQISNPIFHSMHRSGDIAWSLDPTLTVFDQISNFMDDYLENRKRFFELVFCTWLVPIWTTFWQKIVKIFHVVDEEIAKNPPKMHYFVLYGCTKIFCKISFGEILPLNDVWLHAKN